MNSGETFPVLTVYILNNEDELSTLYNLTKKYPTVFLENVRKTKSGFNVGVRQKVQNKDEMETFKYHFQRKLDKKRKEKNNFFSFITKYIGF